MAPIRELIVCPDCQTLQDLRVPSPEAWTRRIGSLVGLPASRCLRCRRRFSDADVELARAPRALVQISAIFMPPADAVRFEELVEEIAQTEHQETGGQQAPVAGTSRGIAAPGLEAVRAPAETADKPETGAPDFKTPVRVAIPDNLEAAEPAALSSQSPREMLPQIGAASVPPLPDEGLPTGRAILPTAVAAAVILVLAGVSAWLILRPAVPQPPPDLAAVIRAAVGSGAAAKPAAPQPSVNSPSVAVDAPAAGPLTAIGRGVATATPTAPDLSAARVARSDTPATVPAAAPRAVEAKPESVPVPATVSGTPPESRVAAPTDSAPAPIVEEPIVTPPVAEAAVPAVVAAVPPSVVAAAPASAAPRAGASGAIAAAPNSSGESGGGSALAVEEQRVRGVIDRYRDAFASLDVGAARAVWPGLDGRKLEKAFEQLSMQNFEFAACDIAVAGQRALADCKGNVRYIPKVGSGMPRVESREWQFDLRRVNNQWRIVAVDTR